MLAKNGELPMRLLMSLTLLVGLMAAGCTHMDGVIKEIKFNKDGDLVLIKCDEKVYWNLYFVAWGEDNCREDVKVKPSKSSS